MVGAQVPAPASVTTDLAVDPDVVVVAVTYNSEKIIGQFLHALPAALEGTGASRVVIVDNDSADSTVHLIRSSAPWVHLIESATNLGYGAGINLGMRVAGGSAHVYVLNPDAVPSAGSVRVLQETVTRDLSIGIAVPRILDHAGELKYSLRREPTIMRALGEAILGGHRAARFPLLGEEIRDADFYVDGATAAWATGAAMFISRAALDRVHGFDQQFFLYSEETDLALRVRDAGMRLRYVQGATVTHPGGEMSRSPFLWSLVAVNRTKLYRKRHGALRSAVYWGVVVLNEALRGASGRRTSRAALRALLRTPPRADQVAIPGPASAR